MTRTAVSSWPAKAVEERQRANASGWVREHQGIMISSRELDALASLPTPSVVARGDKLLRTLNRRLPVLGVTIDIELGPIKHQAWLGHCWAQNQAELVYLIEEVLRKPGLIEATKTHDAFLRVSLTPKGHIYLDDLDRRKPDSLLAFCAMWFDPRLQDVWSKGIEPAIYDAGYEPKRVDRHEHNNKIDDEIIALIRRSRFMVCDFTGNRGGAYFEAGFGRGMGLEVIWTCREKGLHRVHFDARQYNFITWRSDNLPDFRQRLQNRIEASFGRGSYVKP